jgi:tetratricopeptide (TPR) repeat protein
MKQAAILAAACVSLAAILTAAPAFAQSGRESAAKLCEEQRGSAALDACERAIELMPESAPDRTKADVYLHMGIALGELNRNEEALKYLRRAADLDPENAKVWYNEGVALEALNRPSDALRAYRRAVELDPQMTNAWGNRGVTAYRTDRYDEAAKAFDTATDLDPGYFDSRPDQRKMWEISVNKKPTTLALRHEVDLRFSPQLGGIFGTGDHLNVKEFIYLMFDTGVDVQLYRRWFATVSFLYAHTKWQSFAEGGGMNIYLPTVGIKYVGMEADYPEPGETFLDKSRYWFSLGVGPGITDLSGANANTGGAFANSRTSVDFGLSGGLGVDYYFHPNVGVGLEFKVHYVAFDENYVMIGGGPHVVGRF